MNILLITPLYPAYDNQSRIEVTYAVHNFAKYWSLKGHNPLVINTKLVYPAIFSVSKSIREKNKYKNIKNYSIEGIHIIRMPIKRFPKSFYYAKYINKNVRYLSNYLRKNDYTPHVIVCHMLQPSIILAEKLKKIYNVPLIVCLHSGDVIQIKNSFFSRKFIQASKSIDAYGYRADVILEKFEQLMGNFIKGKPSFKVLSGIKEDEIVTKEFILEKASRNIKKIIICCRLDKNKNVDILIRAFSVLAKNTNNNLKLSIIGQGEEKGYLESLAKELNIRADVTFWGAQPRDFVLEEMKKSEVFCMVSERETLGLVYLEAMASGCIVIGTKGQGIDGIIDNKENGFLCNPTEKALIETLSNILNLDEDNRKTIFLNSFNTIKSLTEEETSNKYINDLEYIIKITKKCEMRGSKNE